MNARLNFYQAAPDAIEALSIASTALEAQFSDHLIKALVELRVSQINGCAYCVDLHSQQARALGEVPQRLDTLCVWREVSFFSDRERAALAWAEAVTLVSQTHVPNEVFVEASHHFTPAELVQLTLVVGLMNAWNRLSISFRGQPAHRAA
jgi:AhpD family alkylhydroperoxidase